MQLTREQIIEKLGIKTLDREEQDKLLDQLADTVHTRILLKLTEVMSDADLVNLESIMDADDEQKFDDFIASKVPDYQNWASQIELDTINELENNRIAIEDEAEAMQLSSTPTD